MPKVPWIDIHSNPLTHKVKGQANESGSPLECFCEGISYSTPENCYHQYQQGIPRLLQIEL